MTAYTQILWNKLRHFVSRVGTVDSLFSVLSNVFLLLDTNLSWAHKRPMLMGLAT
ncbi:hypothetical protein H2203_002572, partial [Taxawa tesnikishii (nom. ined.)]